MNKLTIKNKICFRNVSYLQTYKGASHNNNQSQALSTAKKKDRNMS